MKNPVTFIPDKTRKTILLALITWTLFLTIIFQVINVPLQTSDAPAGIVSFELAGTDANARVLVASWDSRAQLFAAFSLGLDYLYMPSYAFTIALASLMAAGRHPGRFSKIGTWLGWGVFLAAIFDAIENLGLWKSLVDPIDAGWPGISYWCAILKFTLIFLGIVYSLIGWILPKKNV